MCSDQYICTEIFICALHIWATVLDCCFGEATLSHFIMIRFSSIERDYSLSKEI